MIDQRWEEKSFPVTSPSQLDSLPRTASRQAFTLLSSFVDSSESSLAWNHGWCIYIDAVAALLFSRPQVEFSRKSMKPAARERGPTLGSQLAYCRPTEPSRRWAFIATAWQSTRGIYLPEGNRGRKESGSSLWEHVQRSVVCSGR